MESLKVGDRTMVTDVTSKDKLFNNVDNGDMGTITQVQDRIYHIRLDNGEHLTLWKSQVASRASVIRGRWC